jgi:hypothetical protein
MKKFEAVEQLLAVVADDVDRCIAARSETLPSVTAAAIRAGAIRYAEGLLCLMSADELCSDAPEHMMLRKGVRTEIEKHVALTIATASPEVSRWVN